MNLSWTLIGGAAALALGCLVMLPVWFFTRRLPDEEWQYAPEGPEIRKPRLSRRTKVRLLVALPVLFTGAGGRGGLDFCGSDGRRYPERRASTGLWSR